ncbi:MAG: histidine phosphatase family protein [Treponema sp.]
MKLFLARHGETDANVNELACGISEFELTEKGKRQAQALANQLKYEQPQRNITTIYVSPLKRAKNTAAYIEKALGITAIPDERLKEMNFGSFEGKKWNTPEFLHIFNNPFLKFPSGESLVQVTHRAYSMLEEVKKKHTVEENILFVCHGVVITTLYTYFKSFSIEEFFHIEIENCQLLEFSMETI